MSWHASFESRAAFDADTPTSSAPSHAEITTALSPSCDQYILARQAAEFLLSRPGVLPRGEDGNVASETKVYVGLSGHANPDHRPATGYANDTIQVTVTQR